MGQVILPGAIGEWIQPSSEVRMIPAAMIRRAPPRTAIAISPALYFWFFWLFCLAGNGLPWPGKLLIALM